MKYCCSLGLVIPAMCFITMNQLQMSYSTSTFSSAHSNSNLSNYTAKDHTEIRLRKFHERSIENGSEALDHPEAIRADHYKRKVAFLENELEMSFLQMKKYHRTTLDQRHHLTSTASTSGAADSYISTIPTSHELSKVGGSANTADLYVSTASNTHASLNVEDTKSADWYVTTTPNSQESSKVVHYTKAESLILDNSKDHNVTKLLAIFWGKEEELWKKEKHFFAEELSQWDISVHKDALLASYKHNAIEAMEKLYKPYLPKVIMYEDVADKMQASFGEDEIVHAHLLLYAMEELNLIQRQNGTSTTQKMILPMLMDKLQEIITPRTVRWLLFLLYGQHPSLSTLRRRVENEPNLTLYEFCWSISKTWDVAERQGDESNNNMACSYMEAALDEFFEGWRDERYKRKGRAVSSLGPLLRSMNILVKKCDEVGA